MSDFAATTDLSRGSFLALGAAGTALPHASALAAASGDATLHVRWYGGGVYELATPDDAQVVLVDAWLWNNTGWAAFGIAKPPELANAAAFAAHLRARSPRALLVALTHDHGDHMGDYFELLRALVAAGLPVQTAGQSDLMRVGLTERFKAAGLDPAQLVVNGGNGINMGGKAVHGGIAATLVPAVHSTAAGFPPAGFVLDVGGARVYASGDTDVFGDMALIGSRYRPQLAVLSAGNGAFTMGPEDAAHAAALVGVAHAIPVHYAHNARVLGPECGERFRAAVAREGTRTEVTVLRPGDVARLNVAGATPGA